MKESKKERVGISAVIVVVVLLLLLFVTNVYSQNQKHEE